MLFSLYIGIHFNYSLLYCNIFEGIRSSLHSKRSQESTIESCTNNSIPLQNGFFSERYKKYTVKGKKILETISEMTLKNFLDLTGNSIQ